MSVHEYDRRYTEYQINRSAARKLIRRLYLWKARSYLEGKTLDIGCGVGELLATLPPGSRGLEYNRDTVVYCRGLGLNVEWYDGFADDWMLSPISSAEGFDSMVISHVLEHLETPSAVLPKLLAAASNLGIHRVLVIVPTRAGYASDPTHLTFVDREMLDAAIDETPWKTARSQYFPGNSRRVGNRFRYHELQYLLVPPQQP